MRFWGSSKLDEIGWCWMHIQAWIWWQGILLQSQFSLFLCILKPEAYAQKLDRSKTPAQLHVMNWHPDLFHTNTFTQRLLHTETFTHRSFYTQKLSHTQKLLHTDAFTHRSERVAPDASKSQFFRSLWRSNLISCERVAAGRVKSQFYWTLCKSQFYGSFWWSNLVSCEILPQFLVIEPRFVRKGCVSCRLVGTAPRLQERNIDKKERARGQESKKAREQEGKRECEDVKIWRCEDVRMWRREDEKMWRWEDVMWGCEDVRTWRCEDVMRMWRCEDEKMWR